MAGYILCPKPNKKDNFLRDGCDRCDGKSSTGTISVFPVTAVTPVTREALREECKDAKYLDTYTLALLLRQIPVPLSVVFF